MAIITLLTDFGTQDEYVGALKGVILTINPTATLVDLTHHIAPQDVRQAAYILKSAYGYFPERTIHLVVVDPGVGSRRCIIAAGYSGHFFIAPDNGLLPTLWDPEAPEELVSIENSALFLHPVSNTFQGRDIMAPAAANLSLGLTLNELGPPLSPRGVVVAALPQPRLNSRGELEGEVVAVDGFGNLITNIQAHHLAGLAGGEMTRRLFIDTGTAYIQGLTECYSQAAAGTVLAVMGSRSCLEIAVNRGRADQYLKIGKGAPVRVALQKEGA